MRPLSMLPPQPAPTQLGKWLGTEHTGASARYLRVPVEKLSPGKQKEKVTGNYLASDWTQ